MVNDVARAFFEAPARRTICAELPEEETHEGDDVGLLLQSLYGTRDASANFQEEVRKVLTKAGSREASTTLARTSMRRWKGDGSWRRLHIIGEQEIFEMVWTGVGEQV